MLCLLGWLNIRIVHSWSHLYWTILLLSFNCRKHFLNAWVICRSYHDCPLVIKTSRSLSYHWIMSFYSFSHVKSLIRQACWCVTLNTLNIKAFRLRWLTLCSSYHLILLTFSCRIQSFKVILISFIDCHTITTSRLSSRFSSLCIYFLNLLKINLRYWIVSINSSFPAISIWFCWYLRSSFMETSIHSLIHYYFRWDYCFWWWTKVYTWKITWTFTTIFRKCFKN